MTFCSLFEVCFLVCLLIGSLCFTRFSCENDSNYSCLLSFAIVPCFVKSFWCFLPVAALFDRSTRTIYSWSYLHSLGHFLVLLLEAWILRRCLLVSVSSCLVSQAVYLSSDEPHTRFSSFIMNQFLNDSRSTLLLRFITVLLCLFYSL